MRTHGTPAEYDDCYYGPRSVTSADIAAMRDECVATLSDALMELDIHEGVLRLIAEYVPHGTKNLFVKTLTGKQRTRNCSRVLTEFD